MISAPLPADEASRLNALRRYGVLDTPPEPALDDITALVARTCNVPIALISLVDADRQWFKSAHGLDVRQTERRTSFCAHAIVQPEGRLVVPDALLDARFIDNPLVCAPPHIRAYAGVALRTPQGQPLGTLCAIDREPRLFTAEHLETLERLGRIVVTLLELHPASSRLRSEAHSLVHDRLTAAHRIRRVDEMVENIAEVLFTTDADGHWTFLNAAWSALSGFEAGESLGRRLTDFVHPDDVAIVGTGMARLLNGDGTSQECSVRCQTRDGGLRWVEVRGRATTDDAGRVTGIVGTVHDITRQREMAAEITRAHKEALRATSTMSEFLSNMSHEIRTPLNGILGFSTILLDPDLRGDTRHYVEGIHRSAEALLALVNDTLDLSRIEAGDLLVEQAPFDLRATVETSVEAAFARAHAKGLEARLVMAPDVPARIIGDASRLRQVLVNLTDNAVKFSAQGRIDVTLRAERSPLAASVLRIEVRDTGVGIPLAKQRLIFDKFTQVDGSSTRQFGGTGLGLAICRQVVTQLGGSIGVESAPGAGALFWVTVPLLAAATPAPAPAAVDPAEPPLRVLMVEDNPTNQTVASLFLRKAGCEVEMAENGAVGVEHALASHFDIVFMDCQLPVMDGYDATRLIRRDPRGATVPIIAMTANAMMGDRERCFAAGMTDYLTKPLKRERVLEMLALARRSRVGRVVEGEPAAPALAVASADERPFDRDELFDVFEDAASIVQVLTPLLDDLPRYRAAVATALAAHDWPAAARSARNIRDTAANGAAGPVCRLAAELERALTRGRHDDVAPLAAALDSACEVLVTALREWLTTLQQPTDGVAA